MIVVDSSVWIAHLRGTDNDATRKLRTVVAARDDEILVGDLILLEVLQGARDEAHAARIEAGLRAFVVRPMLDDVIAVSAARHYRALRARGVSVRKTVDMIIGTFCIWGGHVLLHDDRDFDPMVRHLGLGVV